MQNTQKQSSSQADDPAILELYIARDATTTPSNLLRGEKAAIRIRGLHCLVHIYDSENKTQCLYFNAEEYQLQKNFFFFSLPSFSGEFFILLITVRKYPINEGRKKKKTPPPF